MNPSVSPLCEGQCPEDEHADDWLHLSLDSMGPLGSDLVLDKEDQEEPQETGKLKSKLVSAWLSVRYAWSWKQKSRFSKNSPVTMLGHSYLLSNSVERESFRRSFGSLLWLTYRRGFPQLAGSSLTTDSGWGCVLRTGQMLLAQGLLLHLMPPGWTWCSGQHWAQDDMDIPESHPATLPNGGRNVSDRPKRRCRKMSLGAHLDRRTEPTHRRVVSWFGDHPSAAFGVHQLVELGRTSGKKAGDWYGPSIVAHILCKAVAASVEVPSLAVYVAQDCTVYTGDVRRLCERPPLSWSSTGSSPSWKSVIVLVPVRLGGQALNPSYITCVKNLLTLQCCIGIVGGKPRHSLFFVGFQGDHLLYLDPHYCQSTVDITQDNFPLVSFHCKHPRKMAFTRMDPSCTIGFYAKGQKDFESLCSSVSEVLSRSAEKYPMFTFTEGHGHEEAVSGTAPTNNVTRIHREDKRRRANTSSSMDEFVLL